MTNIQKNQTIQTVSKTGINDIVETVDITEIKEKEKIIEYRRYSEITVDDMKAVFQNEKIIHPTEKEYSLSFQRFCKNIEKIKEKGLGILMFGNPGTGKSFYSNCIMNTLNEKYKVYRTSLYNILEEIRQTYKKNANDDDTFIFNRLRIADLTIFDDLGNEFITDWGKEKMFLIFEFLYKYRKSFIINTNLDEKQLSTFLKINGSRKLIDRIRERCKKYEFNWGSRRGELHKKDFEELY